MEDLCCRLPTGRLESSPNRRPRISNTAPAGLAWQPSSSPREKTIANFNKTGQGASSILDLLCLIKSPAFSLYLAVSQIVFFFNYNSHHPSRVFPPAAPVAAADSLLFHSTALGIDFLDRSLPSFPILPNHVPRFPFLSDCHKLECMEGMIDRLSTLCAA